MNVRDIILGGYCTPQCLLALIPDRLCACRCDGSGHGLLVDAEVDFPLPDGAQARRFAIPSAPAPVLDCASCGKSIGKSREHYVVVGADLADPSPDDEHVIGPCCVKAGTKRLHRRLWPDCEHSWHDVWDHMSSQGTRAGVAARLGLWGPKYAYEVGHLSEVMPTEPRVP